MKQQKTARRAKPVTGTVRPSTIKPMPIATARAVVSLVARQLVTGEITEHAASNHLCDYGVMSASQLDEFFESEIERYGGRKEPVPSSPDDLRALGWMVAVHNDYTLGGKSFTFWLVTKDGHCLKGEGESDAKALNEIRRKVRASQKTAVQP